ncbi:40811_t:CDS:2 [Gigaspora margarita]|uniref:40811_t:CDS:1 n=1 Tax=Gigaspora margarita TaxID=4874 RepID=A0ABN7W1T3_GIGMA|nr:40811_t:CDS:2 [Gigaspora margarita]
MVLELNSQVVEGFFAELIISIFVITTLTLILAFTRIVLFFSLVVVLGALLPIFMFFYPPLRLQIQQLQDRVLAGHYHINFYKQQIQDAQDQTNNKKIKKIAKEIGKTFADELKQLEKDFIMSNQKAIKNREDKAARDNADFSRDDIKKIIRHCEDLVALE